MQSCFNIRAQRPEQNRALHALSLYVSLLANPVIVGMRVVFTFFFTFAYISVPTQEASK